MSFCEHCEGQRFDRARVLRALRRVLRDLPSSNPRSAEEAVELALRAVRALDIPHMEPIDEGFDIVH